MDNKLIDIVKAEFQLRVIEESLARIEKCLDLLTQEQIWHKKNENTNAIGNLILHLAGNIRQYIIAGVGEEKDLRERDKEFVSGYSHTAEELLAHITPILYDANEVVRQLSSSAFPEEVNIQGFPHTRLSAILHVIEHLSYHVGQITYYTKYINNVDTGYYEGLDLDKVGD